jgi:hypothetical protein
MRNGLPLLLIALLLPGCAPDPAPAGPSAPAAGHGAQLSPRDHDRVREAVARGEYVPLAGLIDDALSRHPGEVLEVELENHEYEIEILGVDGVILEFEYDARTGELLEIEVEDD